ncbi:HYC_CC_PP family protein [Xanthomarina sp.]|uniref:HYC_CC_PP family protein n=1 Tax=Xanthomarina sp. TaxID=1931211 RepID=UPI0039C9C367
MKKVFHKIMSMLMAFVVLFSTMSFTINMHYCGGSLMDSAIFQKVETCGMEMDNPLSEGCSITKKDCCKDEQVVLDGQNELQLLIDKISFEQQIFVATFIHSYINLFEGQDENIVPFRDYNPPFLIRDIQKLHETYLI